KEIQEMISLYQREQEETLKKINIEKKNINLLKNKIKDSAEKREKSSLEFKQVEDQLIQVTSKKNELVNILKKELSKKDDCEKRLLTEKNNIKFLYEEIKKNEDEIFN